MYCACANKITGLKEASLPRSSLTAVEKLENMEMQKSSFEKMPIVKESSENSTTSPDSVQTKKRSFLSFESQQNPSKERVVTILGSTYCSGLIQHNGMRFLIMDQPAKANLLSFINELKKHDVKHVFRVCQKPSYQASSLESEGITLYDMPFDDGGYPPKELIEEWLVKIKCIFSENPGCTVAVHCIAGLGRAPVMVAIALIESGMKYEDAVIFIRHNRRGAINSRQLDFLERYRPTKFLKFKSDTKACHVV